MKKERIRKVIADADNQATLLTYSVTPLSVYYTRDTNNPSVVQIAISATNPGENDVTVEAIQVRIVVQADGIDPAIAITSDPSTIIPVSLQPDTWDFVKFDTGIYMASPQGSGIIPAGGSLTFLLQSIIVNDTAGTTNLAVVEKNSSGFPEVNFPIAKIKSALNIDSFAANPVIVSPGGATTLSWTTTAAAQVMLLPGNPQGLQTNGSYTTNVNDTTVYTLTAYGEGPNISKQVTVSVAPVIITSFTASSYQINAGDPVTLTWETENASSCAINPGFPVLPVSGTQQVNPTTDTVYTLTAYSLSGKNQNSSLTVSVNPVSISSFTAAPSYGVAMGTPVTLSWNATSSTSVSLSPPGITVSSSGTQQVIPGTKTIYTLTAQGKNGPAYAYLTVLPMMPGWQMPTTSAPLTDVGKPVLLMKDNQLWLMANGSSSFVFYSEDGSQWNIAGTAPWTQRSSAGGAVLNGQLWLMGGVNTSGTVLNDVWSSTDGKTWTQATAAPGWSARQNFGCVAFAGKLWVMGGRDQAGNALRDVWNSADGITWQQVTANAPWSARSNFGITIFNNCIYILCGLLTDRVTAVNDFWHTSDGINWVADGSMQYVAPRYNPNVATLGDRLYIAGGTGNNSTVLSDLLYMSTTGKWVMQPGIIQSPAPQQSAAVQYQNALWIVGGKSGSTGNVNKTVLYFFPST